MHNGELVRDYLHRAAVRRDVIAEFHRRGNWADVVRDCQAIVELALKALLRACHIDPPRIHDVSAVLLDNQEALPANAQAHVQQLAEASRRLRRDRELAFYGAEDLVPSTFYKREDAERALQDADFVLVTVTEALKV